MIITTEPDGASDAFELALHRSMRSFLTAKQDGVPSSRRYIVYDAEYSWDRAAHDAYKVTEGKDAEQDTRWPFHRIAAVSWLTLTFHSGEAIPTVGDSIVMTAEDTSEEEMVAAFFDALKLIPSARLVTWGGEVKDLAVLRRCAASYDRLLPPQLFDLSPYAQERLDLCSEVSVRAKPVHLPEYAMAVGVPAKPSPSKSIGALVENGRWPEVRDQVLADVLATAMLAIRHLTSRGEITCNRHDTQLAIAEAASTALPASAFVKRAFLPWARGQKARASLKGAVFRCEEPLVRRSA
ncbi:MAG: 3'-5' exonuclease [Qipengyuania sp.]|nr:3'-5' exonuclease [Qipengyuania sp.]